MSLKTINTAIRAIATATANQNTRIQSCAVLCIEHALSLNADGNPINDANPAMRLVVAVAPRFRKPLIDWFATYSRINIGKKGDGFVCSMSKAEGRTNDVEAAKLNPWYETEAASDKDVLPLTLEDFDSRILALVKSMTKKLEASAVIDADKAAFVERIAGLKALRATPAPEPQDLTF